MVSLHNCMTVYFIAEIRSKLVDEGSVPVLISLLDSGVDNLLFYGADGLSNLVTDNGTNNLQHV